jgi:hypothetical protein
MTPLEIMPFCSWSGEPIRNKTLRGGKRQMTKTATNTVMSDVAAETTFLATTGQQMALDTLLVEIGAMKALLPGLTAAQANILPSDAERRARDAALEAMFDNMPV